MTTIKGILAFFSAVPALIALCKTLAKRIEDAETDRKVAQDVRAIDTAFKTKDAAALDAIFNSK